MIEVFAPASGEKLGEVPIVGADGARAAVARARHAQQGWGARKPNERARLLKGFRDVFLDRAEEIAEHVARENGKAQAEAMFHDVAPVALSLTWLAARAPRLLAPTAPSGLMPFPRATHIHRRPHGVVGVISPWNFPVTLPFTPVIEALMAGNAVVLKPSERTPLVAAVVRDLFVEAGLPPDLLQLVTGDHTTGAALIDAGVDFVHFTGSVAAGRKVGAMCGERLVPCTLELGGKAPLLVLPDADLERTAAAIVFGGFSNAGQICISVERVLVPDALHDKLLALVVEKTRALRQGDPSQGDVDVGAMTLPGQMEVVERLIKEATAAGAKVECGGERLPGPGRFFAPTVLSDVTPDMAVAREEIFGPVVPFLRYRDVEEAVGVVADLPVGLAAYVFGEDRRRAREVAEQLRAGSISINDVFTAFAVPELPFGGVGGSGFGRSHGEEGLLAMTRSVSVADDRGAYRPARDLWWFPYARPTTKKVMGYLRKAIKVFDLTSRR